MRIYLDWDMKLDGATVNLRQTDEINIFEMRIRAADTNFVPLPAIKLRAEHSTQPWRNWHPLEDGFVFCGNPSVMTTEALSAPLPANAKTFELERVDGEDYSDIDRMIDLINEAGSNDSSCDYMLDDRQYFRQTLSEFGWAFVRAAQLSEGQPLPVVKALANAVALIAADMK